jgi:hypothetical protein
MAGTITATITRRRAAGWRPRLTEYALDLTCASGAVSATDFGPIFGRLVAIKYDPVAGAGATMTGTADVLITDKFTGAPVISDLSFGSTYNFYRPSATIADIESSLMNTPNQNTSEPNIYRDIFLAGTYQVAIANATTTDTGRVTLVVLEN